MSIGNYGAVKNAIEQVVQANFPPVASRGNQGISILPYVIDRIITRPDFVNTLNAKVYFPTLNAAAVNAVVSTAVQLVALLWDNSQAATDAYIATYGVASGSVTIGTTQQSSSVFALRASAGCVVFPQPLSQLTNTGLSWDSTTTVNPGTARSTVSTVQVALIYLA